MIKRCFEVWNEVIMVLVMIFYVGFFVTSWNGGVYSPKIMFLIKNKSIVKIENNA